MVETLTLQSLPDYCKKLKSGIAKGSAIGLQGDLGAGKTTLVRTLIEQLTPMGHAPVRVVSPSFVLHQTYPNLPIPVEHFDLYRLDNAGEKELDAIGYYDALLRTRDRGGYLFVEWPERITPMALLELSALIKIEVGTQMERIFTLETISKGEGGSKIITRASPFFNTP